jgi:hypothetical protein
MSCIVDYLDSLNERVNELWRLQAESQVELPPTLRFGGAARDALLPSVFDKAFTCFSLYNIYIVIYLNITI